jgi:hypothetical protein
MCGWAMKGRQAAALHVSRSKFTVERCSAPVHRWHPAAEQCSIALRFRTAFAGIAYAARFLWSFG